jgi:hypothetical protein
MFSIGRNTGTVGSYAALDLGNFTSGIYNSAMLFEGNNLWCFVFQSFISETSDMLKGGRSDPSGPMATLPDWVNTITGDCRLVRRLRL